MLKKEERTNPHPSHKLFGHLRGERGKKYFKHLQSSKEKYKECHEAILDPMKGVIVEDNRKGKKSTHLCLFINSCGENIALPLIINGLGKIFIMTIMNIADSKNNPRWFYDEYDKFAEERGMEKMERIWRPS